MWSMHSCHSLPFSRFFAKDALALEFYTRERNRISYYRSLTPLSVPVPPITGVVASGSEEKKQEVSAEHFGVFLIHFCYSSNYPG